MLKLDSKNIKAVLLSLTISFYIFRMAIGGLSYAFVLSLSVLTVLVIFPILKNLKRNIFTLKFLKLILLIVFFYLLALLFTDKISTVIYKDIFNISISFILIIFFIQIVKDDEIYKIFYLNLFRFFSFLGVISVVINLYSLYNNYYIISTDYNFFSLSVFLSIISSYYLYANKRSLFVQVYTFISVVSILLSGSRRAIAILVILYLTLILFYIYNIFTKSNKVKYIINNTKYLMLFSLLVITVVLFFATIITPIQRRCVVNIISNSLEKKITQVVGRYSTFGKVNEKSNIILNHKLWGYPNYNWIYTDKIVFPLKGENVDKIPINAVGYLIDSTSVNTIWKKNAVSFTYFYKNILDTINKTHFASVYCYVSKNFSGERVRIEAQGSLSGKNADSYDFKNKGEWQQLKINFDNNCLSIYGSFILKDNHDFKNLHGFVIFAAPSISRDNFYNQISSNIYNGLFNNDYNENKNKTTFQSVLNDYLVGFLLNRYKKKKDEKLILLASELDCNNKEVIKHLKEIRKKGTNRVVIHRDNKFERNKISKVETEAERLKRIKMNNYIIYSRSERWKYAVELFKKYSVIEKIFGGGFDYVNKFGKKYYYDESIYDYPHNPIISSFLYSGIIGGFFYIYFLIMAFFYYWKYRKYHMVFFLMYLVTFFFAFFSGNSHFSIPIFTFLSFYPFLTRYMVKTGKISLNNE